MKTEVRSEEIQSHIWQNINISSSDQSNLASSCRRSEARSTNSWSGVDSWPNAFRYVSPVKPTQSASDVEGLQTYWLWGFVYCYNLVNSHSIKYSADYTSLRHSWVYFTTIQMLIVLFPVLFHSITTASDSICQSQYDSSPITKRSISGVDPMTPLFRSSCIYSVKLWLNCL